MSEVAAMSLAKLIADAERGSPAARSGSPKRPPPSELESEGVKASPTRVLRVEVAGMLHDWFCVEEMSHFLRTPAFAKVLRENIARYFHVPVDRQAVYDEDGLLTSNADFRRALQRVSPKIYVYDMQDMAQELRDRTVEELESLEAEVQLSWDAFGGGVPAASCAKENSAPKECVEMPKAEVTRHALPVQGTLRQTVSTGNLMMPFALPGHPPKAQHGIGFSPRPSVAPPICSTSRRASCIATPIQPIPIPSQTPRATATAQRPAQWQSAAGAYSYHQARLVAAPVAQAATSGTTLLARAASVPTVPTISRIIRPGALQTPGNHRTTQTPRTIRMVHALRPTLAHSTEQKPRMRLG